MASTDTTDISKILISLGVEEKLANNIQNRMNGVDYLNLVNSVDDETPNGRKQAEGILAKYGIKIRKVPHMDTTRLESIFAGVRSGKEFDEAAVMQHVRPISEMESIGAKMSGYSNYVRAANDTDAETLRDWLEENEFDYQNNDKLTFLVQSADREKAYRLNHFMGKMSGKTSVMDDLNEGTPEQNKQALLLRDCPFKGKYGEIIASDFGSLRVIGAEPTYTPNGAPDWVVVAQDKNGRVHKIQYDTANMGLYGNGGKFNFDEAKKPEFISSMIDRIGFSGQDPNRKTLGQDEKTKRLITRGFRAGFADSWPSDTGVTDADMKIVHQAFEDGKAARAKIGPANVPKAFKDTGPKKLTPEFIRAADAAMKQTTDESVVEEKNKMAKDDLPAKRNPFAAQVIKKSGGGAHNSKDPSRKDAFSRNAKHKGKHFEEIEESAFSQGESVTFEGHECPVHIPAGPNGTVGIIVDGKVRMVSESDITRIDEGVLGMTKVDPLYRLRELAGFKSPAPAVREDDFGTVDPMADLEVADDFDDPNGSDIDPAGAGEFGDFGGDEIDTMDGGFDDEFGPDVPGGDIAGIDSAEPLDGMDGGADAAFGAMGGMPGDLPPGGAGMNVAPADSQAYTQIQDHLNNIQQSLGDVKLSEYRSLIAKLEALAVQVKSMGRDYLGEQRKLKK